MNLPVVDTDCLIWIINKLRKIDKNVDIHILRSSSNVNLDAILGYKTKDKKISFMDEYWLYTTM